jgi:hypothetical protein
MLLPEVCQFACPLQILLYVWVQTINDHVYVATHWVTDSRWGTLLLHGKSSLTHNRYSTSAQNVSGHFVCSLSSPLNLGCQLGKSLVYVTRECHALKIWQTALLISVLKSIVFMHSLICITAVSRFYFIPLLHNSDAGNETDIQVWIK